MGNLPTTNLPPELSLRQAAEATGKRKQTILKAIQDGRLSASRTETGEWRIQAAELFRVYQPVAVDGQQNRQPQRQEPLKNDALPGWLPPDEAATLRTRLEMIEAERERERQGLQSTIDDLRRRLDGEAEERRRLTFLLTDQREKPALEPPPSQNRGFWTRLLGR